MGAAEEITLFRDVQVAQEIRSMAALGKFPKEITVYGLVYYKDGKRNYMISADAAKLISFLNDAENRKYFPTRIDSYSERLAIPEGYEEDTVHSIKLKLARQLQADYPAEAFAMLEAISIQPANDCMDKALTDYCKQLESVFFADKIQAFQTLCTRAYLRKNLSQLVYQQLQRWCQKRLAQLESYVPPSKDKEKSFYGFAVLQNDRLERCIINANLNCIYEEQCASEQEGKLLTAWHKKTFSAERQESLNRFKAQMAGFLEAIYDAEMIALLEQVEQVPSVIAEEQWQIVLAQLQAMGEKPEALGRHYGQLWGVGCRNMGVEDHEDTISK